MTGLFLSVFLTVGGGLPTAVPDLFRSPDRLRYYYLGKAVHLY